MFVVDETGNFAVNIEKAETIRIVLNKTIKKYCIVFDNFDGTNPYTIADYETHEAAERAFQQMIIAIAKGDKVFFMPSEEEITAETIREMMDKTPIKVLENGQS